MLKNTSRTNPLVFLLEAANHSALEQEFAANARRGPEVVGTEQDKHSKRK